MYSSYIIRPLLKYAFEIYFPLTKSDFESRTRSKLLWLFLSLSFAAPLILGSLKYFNPGTLEFRRICVNLPAYKKILNRSFDVAADLIFYSLFSHMSLNSKPMMTWSCSGFYSSVKQHHSRVGFCIRRAIRERPRLLSHWDPNGTSFVKNKGCFVFEKLSKLITAYSNPHWFPFIYYLSNRLQFLRLAIPKRIRPDLKQTLV